MQIQISKEGRVNIMSLAGKLDAISAPDLERQAMSLTGAGSCFLIIDFSQLEYISSAGLRVLLVMAKRIQSKKGQLHFANVTGTVMKVFEISGFGSIFRMWNSIPEAITAIG